MEHSADQLSTQCIGGKIPALAESSCSQIQPKGWQSLTSCRRPSKANRMSRVASKGLVGQCCLQNDRVMPFWQCGRCATLSQKLAHRQNPRPPMILPVLLRDLARKCAHRTARTSESRKCRLIHYSAVMPIMALRVARSSFRDIQVPCRPKSIVVNKLVVGSSATEFAVVFGLFVMARIGFNVALEVRLDAIADLCVAEPGPTLGSTGFRAFMGKAGAPDLSNNLPYPGLRLHVHQQRQRNLQE